MGIVQPNCRIAGSVCVLIEQRVSERGCLFECLGPIGQLAVPPLRSFRRSRLVFCHRHRRRRFRREPPSLELFEALDSRRLNSGVVHPPRFDLDFDGLGSLDVAHEHRAVAGGTTNEQRSEDEEDDAKHCKRCPETSRKCQRHRR